MLGLRFCARAFSSCGKWGPLFIAVRGPLSIAVSLVAEHRLQTCRLSNCGSRAWLLRGMWDLPRPGLEPVSPALAGRFSTTAPPEKPFLSFLFFSFFFFLSLCPADWLLHIRVWVCVCVCVCVCVRERQRERQRERRDSFSPHSKIYYLLFQLLDSLTLCFLVVGWSFFTALIHQGTDLPVLLHFKQRRKSYLFLSSILHTHTMYNIPKLTPVIQVSNWKSDDQGKDFMEINNS